MVRINFLAGLFLFAFFVNVLNINLDEDDDVTISYLNVYFFNWTNPDDLLNSTIKPKFEEVGPYRYKQVQHKVDGEYVINYYMEQSDSSTNDDSDVITTLNFVPLTLMHRVRDIGFFMRYTVSSVLKALDVKIHIQKTVKELMFEGYDDPVINIISSMSFTGNLDNRFGWFYGKNGSINNRTISYLGARGKKLKLFSQNEITPEELTEIGKDDIVEMLIPGLCQPIKLYRDVQTDSESVVSFQSENVPLIQCDETLPVYTSSPYFLGENVSYIEAIEGLKSAETNHEIRIGFDTKLGTVVKSNVRLQTNILLQPTDVEPYDTLPELMVPILWRDYSVN